MLDNLSLGTSSSPKVTLGASPVVCLSYCNRIAEYLRTYRIECDAIVKSLVVASVASEPSSHKLNVNNNGRATFVLENPANTTSGVDVSQQLVLLLDTVIGTLSRTINDFREATDVAKTSLAAEVNARKSAETLVQLAVANIEETRARSIQSINEANERQKAAKAELELVKLQSEQRAQSSLYQWSLSDSQSIKAMSTKFNSLNQKYEELLKTQQQTIMQRDRALEEVKFISSQLRELQMSYQSQSTRLQYLEAANSSVAQRERSLSITSSGSRPLSPQRSIEDREASPGVTASEIEVSDDTLVIGALVRIDLRKSTAQSSERAVDPRIPESRPHTTPTMPSLHLKQRKIWSAQALPGPIDRQPILPRMAAMDADRSRALYLTAVSEPVNKHVAYSSILAPTTRPIQQSQAKIKHATSASMLPTREKGNVQAHGDIVTRQVIVNIIAPD